KTPAQQSWAGAAPGRRSHLFNSGLSSTGVNPPAVQRWPGNHDVWKFPQRSEEIGTLPTATKSNAICNALYIACCFTPYPARSATAGRLSGLLRVLLSDFDRMDGRFQGEVAQAVQAQSAAS